MPLVVLPAYVSTLIKKLTEAKALAECVLDVRFGSFRERFQSRLRNHV